MNEDQEAGQEVIEAGIGRELAARQKATLFRTDDPGIVLDRARLVANQLQPVLQESGLTTRIGRREHVSIEGWQTLGAMLGVTAIVTWTRELDDGFEARAESRTLDGRIVGAAESECRRSEKRWKDAESYAVRSMAQTRALSRALASPLRFIVTLAGYEGTPAEEMPASEPPEPRDPEPAGDPLPDARVNELGRAIGAIELSFEEVVSLFGQIGAGAPAANRSPSLRKALRALTEDQANQMALELGALANLQESPQ